MSEKRKSIKDFLTRVASDSVAVKSLFEVSIYYNYINAEISNLSFYVTDIDLPGKKITTSTLYREGREYDIPIIYDNNREFTMTVLCDDDFTYYKTFSDVIMYAGKFGEPGQFTIKIVPTTKINLSSQRIIELQHVFFESLGSIQFGHNSRTELITFTVMGRFRNVEFKDVAISSATDYKNLDPTKPTTTMIA